MGLYDYTTRDVGYDCDIPGDNSGRVWSTIHEYEWWETFGLEGTAYSTGATREEAIDNHLDGNRRLQASEDQINQMRIEAGQAPDWSVGLTPVCGVRHMKRCEMTSGWDKQQSSELLDNQMLPEATA